MVKKDKPTADDKTDSDASGMRHFIYHPLIIVLLLPLLLVVIGLAAYQFVPHYVPIQKLQNFWAAPSPLKTPNIKEAAIPDIKPDIKIDATNVPVAVPPPIQMPTLTLKAVNRVIPAGRPAGRDLAADTRLLLHLLLLAENGQNYAQALQQAMQQGLIDEATHAALAPYATQGVPSLKQVNRLYQQFRAQYKQAISSAIITNPTTTDDDMPPDAPRFIMWLSRLGGGHIRVTRLPTTAETTPPAPPLPTIEQLDALILAGDLHQTAPLVETLLTDAPQTAPMQNAPLQNATIQARLIDWHDALKIYLLTQPILADLRTKILQRQQP